MLTSILLRTPGRSLVMAGLFLWMVLICSCNPVGELIHSEEVLRWEPEIVLFDSLNAIEKADPNTILVTGSSSVRLWDSIRADLAPYRVMKRGYGGAKLTDFNHYAERIIQPGPFKAILVFVANDISAGEHDRTPGEVLDLFKSLVKQVRERNPGTPVFWIETTPTPSRLSAVEQVREASERIRKYCERNPDLHFIPTYDIFTGEDQLPDSTWFRSDMLHLNRSGYRIWSERIREALMEEGITP
jgi:lysophospholipase L1-like esterase